MTGLDASRLMTFEEFAAHVGVSKRLVQSWASDPDEKFPLIFLSERAVRVRVSEGNAWVDRRSERMAQESADDLVRLRAERAAEARRQLTAVHHAPASASNERGQRGAGGGRKSTTGTVRGRRMATKKEGSR